MVEAVKKIEINLKPNIQDLQADVIDLLQDVSALMFKAQQDLNDETSKEKYAASQKQIEQEIKKVENLELRMAIVAPMKAGKSTIINAIVGQDLLPSRNAAMTTIPTKISFDNTVDKPTLTLSENTLNLFRDVWLSLQQKIEPLSPSELEESISQYPHLINSSIKIKSTSFDIASETFGKDNISKNLFLLNDIVRLCCVFDPNKNPLNKLRDIPEIKTPFWRSNNTEQEKQLGNLVIVDTPGANEAGEKLELNAVVKQELERCSIVLIVLDFTQLNNKAAEAVKRQVQPIIDVIGKDHLYVLVNKVDQRLPGDMTPEEVTKFVYNDLKLSESEDSNRIFEISARQAFSATKFLLELQQNPEIELANMSSIEALAKQVLGNRWERKLQKTTVEDLQEEAEYLWEDSGFDKFIINSIQALIANAAPECIKTALEKSSYLLKKIRDKFSIRASAITEDASKLEAEINALNADLQHLELCRSRLKSVDTIKSKLQANLDNILKQLLEDAKISVETHFKKEEDNRSSALVVYDRKARDFFFQDLGDFNFIPKSIRDRMKYKNKDVLEFDSEEEANKFVNDTIAWSKERAEELLSQAKLYAEKEISISRKELLKSLEKETKEILEKAHQRLQKKFNIELSFPPNPQLNSEIGIINFKVNNVPKKITDYKTKIDRPWYFLFLIEIERKVEIQRTKSVYTVSLQDIVRQINSSIEKNINRINFEVIRYFDVDFKNAVNDYFAELKAYLSDYSDNLKKTKADQEKIKAIVRQELSNVDYVLHFEEDTQLKEEYFKNFKKLETEKKQQLIKSFRKLIDETDKHLKMIDEFYLRIQKL